jgi:hypothetical protein
MAGGQWAESLLKLLVAAAAKGRWRECSKFAFMMVFLK